MTSSPPEAPARVLIVDDDPIVRQSVSMMVAHAGSDVVAIAVDGSDAVQRTREHRPHVVLMDVHMPVLSGPEATAEILRIAPSTRVIAMTSLGTEEALVRMITAGAAGFLVKDRVMDEVEHAIDAAMRGEGFVSPGPTAQLLRRYADASADTDRESARQRFAVLTDREKDVAVRIAEGIGNSAIAAELFISVSTVKTHIEQVQLKLGVTGRPRIAIMVDRAGFGPRLG
ncbi:MAG: response regulator transcription factor [Candidatus Microbacterium stercoravium]